MYYLQSRYYDPEVCRFINADVFASTGQGVIGCNMFVYCNNNVVNCYDSAGALPCQNTMRMTCDGGLNTEYHAYLAAKELEESKKTILDNTEVQKVKDANVVSGFNGRLVIKTPLMSDSGFSFGIIFVGNDVDETLLRHEYGHTLQMEQLGAWIYLAKVVLPSIKAFWGDVTYDEYYSLPYEFVADVLGQVERENYVYSDTAYQDAIDYWGDLLELP